LLNYIYGAFKKKKNPSPSGQLQTASLLSGQDRSVYVQAQRATHRIPLLD